MGTGTGIKTLRSRLESVWHSFVHGCGRQETPLDCVIGFDIVPLLATSCGGKVLTMTWLYTFGGGGGGGVGGLGGGGGVFGTAGGSGSGGGCWFKRLDLPRVTADMRGGGAANDWTFEMIGSPLRCWFFWEAVRPRTELLSTKFN